MRSFIMATALLGTVFVLPGAQAQTQPSPAPATPAPMTSSPAPMGSAASTRPAEQRAGADAVVPAAELERGANSFTEGQARSRFEAAGFSAVDGLTKDDAGFWRAHGMRDGGRTDLAMDFRGRIAAGPGVATLPRTASDSAPSAAPAAPAPARSASPAMPPAAPAPTR